MKRRISGREIRYKSALISLAAFGNGYGKEKGELTVDDSYDCPCCANEARRALGKQICKLFKEK